MEFPSYYRFPDSKTYIGFLGTGEFEEVKLFRGRADVNIFTANDFLMRNHLSDLMGLALTGQLIECTEDEYRAAKGITD